MHGKGKGMWTIKAPLSGNFVTGKYFKCFVGLEPICVRKELF